MTPTRGVFGISKVWPGLFGFLGRKAIVRSSSYTMELSCSRRITEQKMQSCISDTLPFRPIAPAQALAPPPRNVTITISGGTPMRIGTMLQPSPPDTMRSQRSRTCPYANRLP